MITLKLNAKGFQGNIKKTATVYSNDPQQPRVTLTMQGIVKTLIDVRPATNVAFRGLADQQTEKVIDLVGSSHPFHIQKVESSLGEKITYKVETVEDGKHYQLKITNGLKQGNYSGFIKASTDLPQKPEIIVRISGNIEGDIAVKPQTILVGKLAAQQPPRQGKILVVSNREKAFNITKLTYDEQFIKVTQEPLAKEPGYTLEVVPLMENIAAGSRRQTTLTVEADATPGMKYDVQVHLINSADSPDETEDGKQPGRPNSADSAKKVDESGQAKPPTGMKK